MTGMKEDLRCSARLLVAPMPDPKHHVVLRLLLPVADDQLCKQEAPAANSSELSRKARGTVAPPLPAGKTRIRAAKLRAVGRRGAHPSTGPSEVRCCS